MPRRLVFPCPRCRFVSSASPRMDDVPPPFGMPSLVPPPRDVPPLRHPIADGNAMPLPRLRRCCTTRRGRPYCMSYTSTWWTGTCKRGSQAHAGADSDESGRKSTENRSTVFIFIFLNENGSRSRTAGNKNGNGINSNTKTGKYGRKIDGNER
jgi:hypothetical protein